MSDGLTELCGNCGTVYAEHRWCRDTHDHDCDPECDVRLCPDGTAREWRSETDEDRAALRAAAMGL